LREQGRLSPLTRRSARRRRLLTVTTVAMLNSITAPL
jgi:hypothetical protein